MLHLLYRRFVKSQHFYKKLFVSSKGFDTVSTAMAFCSYELLVNPEVQKKLQEEIDEVENKLKGKPLTYEILQSMKYMDQVISETLRKWPPAAIMDRFV